jgi:hypothetical protein
MIKGMHGMFYSSQSAALRKFLREKLELKATDIGHGWLIFEVPDAEIGCHPAHPKKGASSGTMDISFYVDDLESAVAKLKKKGVKFKGPIEDHGYGLISYFKAPGNFYIQLYQPRYKRKSAKKKR